MRRDTKDAIYSGFNNVGSLAIGVLTGLIILYYTLNELGIKKYNGLITTLIPVALIELTVSIAVVNWMDFVTYKENK